jgi:branched-chain amino acid transport system substrate-binding protein
MRRRHHSSDLALKIMRIAGLNRRVTERAVVAALLLVSLGCRGKGRTSDDVAIGVALNPQRPGMHTVYRGVELAIEQLNVERAGKGKPLVMRRGPQNIIGAVQIAALMRDDPSVIAVVGHPESGATLDATAVYEDLEHAGANALAAVSPTGTSPALSGRSEWIFRVCPSDLAAAEAAARYVLDSLGARRASVIYRNDPYGKDWTRTFAGSFTKAGGQIVQRDPYLAGVTEWAAYAGLIRRLAPDVLLFPGGSEDAEPFIAAMRAEGVRVPFIGGDAVAPLAQKPDLYRGVKFTAFFVPERPTTPEGRAFVEAYRKKYNEMPDPRAALSYDAALVIGRAINEVGPDRTKVRDYISEIGTRRPALKGATGPIAFNAKHDVINKPVVIATVGQ